MWNEDWVKQIILYILHDMFDLKQQVNKVNKASKLDRENEILSCNLDSLKDRLKLLLLVWV